MKVKFKNKLPKLSAISICMAAIINVSISSVEAVPTFGKQQPSILKSNSSGNTSFLAGKNNSPLSIRMQPGQNVERAIANQFSAQFGIRNPSQNLRVMKSSIRNDKGKNIRYQQFYSGLPVIGGQLVANTNKNNQLLSMSGEVSPDLNVSTKPKISSEQATKIATEVIARLHEISVSELNSTKPVLSIYDPKLIGIGTSVGVIPASLGWKIDVKAKELLPIREFVVVDAETGAISVHFNQVDSVKNRLTFTANNTFNLPGTFICAESDPMCVAGDADAQAAHIYASDTYDFYLKYHNRDSLDGQGQLLISSVHVGPVGFQNAFWDGFQMAYGDGFSLADDVVAHELTHGVTESTSNLFYHYQSGAINESFSDVWGEFVDQTNGRGTDNPEDRWKMGEDLVYNGVFPFVIRDMANPTTKSHPDRMTSELYFTGDGDSGGVHYNSAINNKAAYLLTDGGTFNNHVIKPLGFEKVAKLYYEVQTNYLTSGSTYLDLYYAMDKACSNLVVSNTLTADDCVQVTEATRAVEMEKQPIESFNPQAQVCETGKTPTTLFFDSFENGTANWDLPGIFPDNWFLVFGYAGSGDLSLYAPGARTTSEFIASMNSDVFLPVDAKPYLHFKHIFEFPALGAGGLNDDGGVLEYSLDSGVTWSDAGNYIEAGRKYNGVIQAGTTNPLAGRDGFVTNSHGYNSTRLNLEPLKGQPIRFRWIFGADDLAGSLGWVIDDVNLYTCK